MGMRFVKRWGVCSICAGLALGVAVGARGAGTVTPAAVASAKIAITKVCDEQRTAFEAKDYDKFFATLTPDYIDYDDDGEAHSLQHERDVAVKIGAMMQNPRIREHIVSIEVERDGAIVNVSSHLEFDMIRSKDHRQLHAVMDESDREFWVQVKGVWKEKISRTIKFKDNSPGDPSLYANPAST